jgi:hypothetical protein
MKLCRFIEWDAVLTKCELFVSDVLLPASEIEIKVNFCVESHHF